MPVLSSSLVMDGPVQADGSRWCVETHQTHLEPIELRYLAAEGTDCQAVMVGRVAALNTQLADAEEHANYERDGAPTLVGMTAAQFASRLRQRFRSSSREDTCRLAYWLLRRIAAGHITDTQARNAFGLSSAQWTTLKANKLQPRSDAWAVILAATGE